MAKGRYWIKLIPAVVWHILYLIFCNSFGKNTRVYCDLIFYLVIAVYFFFWRDWRFSEWKNALKNGKSFWIPVLFAALGMVGAFGAGLGIAMLFPNTSDGMGVFGVTNWQTLAAFALVTIFLPPISEEVFYRKAITAFGSKTAIFVTTIISVTLYASEHSLMPLGLLQAGLWAIPYNLVYIKTKNVYICMTAHFICNFVFNGITVVSSAVRLAG